MSERIQKLAEQALDQAVPETWSKLSPEQLSKFKDKFAELIIRETLEVARAGIEFGDSMEDAVEQYFEIKL